MKRLMKYIRPYVGMIILAMTIKLLGAGLELLIPYLMEIILDDIVPARQQGKIFLYGGFMLLCAAGLMLWMRQEMPEGEAPIQTPQPAQVHKPSERDIREAAYDKDIAALEKLLQSGAADAQTQTQAAQRMERMVEEHQCETAIEEALKRAGHAPVLVLCQNGALTVMTQENLTAEQSAAVLSICIAHADVAAENVRIMQAQP